ncbi:MAG: hypothetical protein LC128_01755 [Chitinophagales bacterium]|nr:hypothetical protein [Chitinophagales bacterium]
MEVHHHPKIEKKRFKEYFFEFIMIFLAVTLGFFAESIREHFVAKNIENEYIHSLLQDLKSDSSDFDKIIARNDAGLKNIDASIHLLNAPVITDSISKMLYYSHRSNPYFGTLLFNLRTITQLKSAGGFRLISNQQVSDSIVIYNEGIEWAAWLREELLAALKNDRESGFYIFNDALVSEYNSDSAILSSPKQFRLLTTDKNILIPYANKLMIRYDWLASYRGQLAKMQRQCNNLIQLIKEEYNVHEE